MSSGRPAPLPSAGLQHTQWAWRPALPSTGSAASASLRFHHHELQRPYPGDTVSTSQDDAGGFQKHTEHPADSKEEDRGTGSQVPRGPCSPDAPTETLGVTGQAALGLIAGAPRRAREGSVGAGASESPVAMGSGRGPGRPTTGLPQAGRQGPPWTCSTQTCGPGAQGLGDTAHSTTRSLLSPYPRRWGGCRLLSDQRS